MKSERSALLSTLSRMKSDGFDYLVKITAIDYADRVDVVYIVRDVESSKDQLVEVSLSPDSLSLPTVINIHPSADWYERELSEMFGISIEGRNARRLLLRKWDGTDPPLRKSFQWGAQYKTADDAQ